MKKLLFLLIILSFLLLPAISLAAYGLEETAGAAKLDKTAPGELPVLIGKILGTGLSLVGVLFFALMLYGGLTWMLARGNSEQESKALDTITAAIIGIVIVLASYAITNFVFKNIGPGSGTSSGGGSDNNVAVEKCQVSTSDLDGYCGADNDCLIEYEMEGAQVCKKNGDNCEGEIVEAIGYCEANTKEGCLAEPANYICKWGK